MSPHHIGGKVNSGMCHPDYKGKYCQTRECLLGIHKVLSRSHVPQETKVLTGNAIFI